eukprot:TRINITY_DN34970_c0_g1_i2.p2 TRINITY_DN34970_c0_g1~~TRINITY_DN34970_c0_g1_i2.p2  ORF type:complete len:260 (-),score=52.85 TRINITY_DN34970_c0_g1_i2:303-1082(-)
MPEYKFIQRPAQVSANNAFNEAMRIVCESWDMFMDSTDGVGVVLGNGGLPRIINNKENIQLSFPPLSQEVLMQPPQEFCAPIDEYRMQLSGGGSVNGSGQVGIAQQAAFQTSKPAPDRSKGKKKYKPRKSKLLAEFDNMSNEEEEVDQDDDYDDQDGLYEDYFEYLTPENFATLPQQKPQQFETGLDSQQQQYKQQPFEQLQQQSKVEIVQTQNKQPADIGEDLVEMLNADELANYGYIFGDEAGVEEEILDDRNDPDY